MFNVANYAPPVPALPGIAGYKALQQQQDTLFKQFKNMEIVKREIDAFRSKMQKVDSAEDVTGDYRTFNFILKSYGVEDFDYANNLIKRVLSEDVSDPRAISNRLKNPTFREMAADFQKFLTEKNLPGSGKGSGGPPKEAEQVLDKIVQDYARHAFEESVGRNAPEVAQAMRFKRTIGDAQFYYNIIGDQKNYEVIRKAFNLPRQFVNQDVDAQTEKLKEKFSLEELKDPKRQDEIVRRFLSIAQVQGASGVSAEQGIGSSSATAISLLGGAGGGAGSGGGAILPGMSGSSSSLLSSATASALNSGSMY